MVGGGLLTMVDIRYPLYICCCKKKVVGFIFTLTLVLILSRITSNPKIRPDCTYIFYRTNSGTNYNGRLFPSRVAA